MNFKMFLYGMKMTSPHNKKKNRKFFPLIILAVILLAIILFGFSGIFSSSTLFVASPIFSVRDSFNNWYQFKSYVIKDKESLVNENLKLKERLIESEMKLITLGVLENENSELKSLLGIRTEERRGIVASVLLRPPQVPYDIIIIDIGEDDGVKEGMLVGVYGDILLGFVEEVFNDTSRVRLYSRSGEKVNVFINNTNIFTTAVGSGGGNFEITIPRVDEVEVGSLVTTLGTEAFVLGIVEFIKADMADAFQRVLFRIPVNIQELKWVEVYPDLTNASFPQVPSEKIDKND